MFGEKSAVSLGVPEIGQGAAPGLPDGRISASQGNAAEMRWPLKSGVVADQKFAAPDFTVGPKTRSIERDANHGTFEPVFRHARGNVRMMMLHADFLHAIERQCESRREIS